MTIYAQSLVRRAQDTSQDNTSIRWPLRELVRYLNDGQREIVLYRPDSMSTNATVALVAGSKQALPANGTKLIEISRNNNGTTKRAVRLVNREILDSQSPGWHSITGVTEILHYMYDPRDPKTFYVFPPAAGATASLDIVYSANPTDIAVPADGASLPTDSTADNSAPTVVLGTISVPDIYANALVDYMLYRTYSKDADYAGNAARAQAHYAVFANTLGIEIKATMAVAPVSQSNPNAGRVAAAS